MPKKRKMKTLVPIILALIVLASCKQGLEPKAPIANEGKKMVINNILTEQSQADLRAIMDKKNLDKARVSRFFDQVDFFNKNVDHSLLIKDDYIRTNKSKSYDFYAIQDDIFSKSPSFTGINCRIATFGLVGDKISIENTDNPNMSVVEIDNTSFTNPPVPSLDKDEIKKFNKFYSAIPTENKDDKDFQTQKIKDFWKANGISFPNSDDYKVISVFVFSSIDENTNELFIGHTGLLIKLDDARILFVEKLAFTAPYQAIIFENTQNLYDYLMETYDDSNAQYPIKPLIFADDKLLK